MTAFALGVALASQAGNVVLAVRLGRQGRLNRWKIDQLVGTPSEVWGPARMGLEESMAGINQAPLECPRVDSKWLRESTGLTPEQYESSKAQAHREHDVTPSPLS